MAYVLVPRGGRTSSVDVASQHHHRVIYDAAAIRYHEWERQLRMKPVHLVIAGFAAVLVAKTLKGLLNGFLGLSL
jgi:hypothetical protein